ncbi:MAG: hypothetical protein QOD93_4390, partial [Acetobacteraceae bacterium]|nr:hypothetical protein [Acetobacteraceae bacterium]
RPVVEAFVRPMLDARHDLTLGSGAAAQLAGDQHPRRSPLLLQKLAEQAFGGLLVAPTLRSNFRPHWRIVWYVTETPRAMGGNALVAEAK